MLIREATLSDISQIKEFRDILYNENKSFINKTTIDIIKQTLNEFTSDHNKYIIAIDINKIIGHLIFKVEIQNNKGFVLNIAVLNIAKGTGLASKLIEYIINYAIEINLTFIELIVHKDNIRAIKFYEKLGFKFARKFHGKNNLVYRLDISKGSIPVIAKTPKDLLKWMNSNLTYHGVSKEYLYTANDVIKYKKAHCWESTELARQELINMGYECKILYLENEGTIATHSTLLYKKENNWYWFEWAWFLNEGIHGPYNNLNKLIKFIIDKFINSNNNCNIARLGYGVIHENMTQIEYINMCLNWDSVINKNKSLLSNKW